VADTKLTGLSELSVVALDDLTYIVDDVAGTPTSVKLSVNRLMGLLHHVCQGRLTTESGVSVSTSDRADQSTIYWALHNGNRIGLYDGTRWKLYTFTERSLALSSLTANKNYDVFLYDNAGTLTLELSAAWTNDTTRADALAVQDGVMVKDGATTRRWLGTIRTTDTDKTQDTAGGTTTQVGGKRFVWNRYNQVLRHMFQKDTTNDWSYTTQTYRVQNGATAPLNCCEYVTGDAFTTIEVTARGSVSLQTNTSHGAAIGVGVDSTSAFSGIAERGYNGNAGFVISALGGRYIGHPGLGYHFLANLEKGGDGTCVFNGDNGGESQSGMTVQLMC
jgi:hypothetical protein